MSSTMQNPKIRFQASARDGSVEYAELLTILCKSAAMPGPFTTSVYGIAGRSEPILEVQICILHIIQPPSIDFSKPLVKSHGTMPFLLFVTFLLLRSSKARAGYMLWCPSPTTKTSLRSNHRAIIQSYSHVTATRPSLSPLSCTSEMEVSKSPFTMSVEVNVSKVYSHLKNINLTLCRIRIAAL